MVFLRRETGWGANMTLYTLCFRFVFCFPAVSVCYIRELFFFSLMFEFGRVSDKKTASKSNGVFFYLADLTIRSAK